MSNKSKLSCSKKKKEEKERPCMTCGHLLYQTIFEGDIDTFTVSFMINVNENEYDYDYFNPHLSVILEVQHH